MKDHVKAHGKRIELTESHILILAGFIKGCVSVEFYVVE